jgi:hypothetical protein
MSQETSSILSLWKERIKTLVQYSERRPVAGEDWYLVSGRWWREALQILEYNGTHDTRDFFGPGVLDNSELLETPGATTTTTTAQTEFENERGTIPLKSNLQYRQDYVLLPHEGWNALCSWYVDFTKLLWLSALTLLNHNINKKNNRRLCMTWTGLERTVVPPLYVRPLN